MFSVTYPQRKSHRLTHWDYAQNGYYYITICTQNRRGLFSEIRQCGLDAQVIPTAIGQIVLRHWYSLPAVYPGVHTDCICLMPNHIHGILILEQAPDQPARSLSQVVRGFKSVVTREYNQLVPPQQRNRLWQSSFYDEIIRNDEMLYDIRKYIMGNPSKWLDDPLFIK